MSSNHSMRSSWTLALPFLAVACFLFGIWLTTPISYAQEETQINNIAVSNTFPNACVQEVVTAWTFTGETLAPASGTGALTIGSQLSETSFVTGSILLGGSGDPGLRLKGWISGTLDLTQPAYLQFDVDTTGFSGISLQFAEQRPGNNGPLAFALFYSSDRATYTQFATVPISDNSRWRLQQFDLSGISGLNNNPNASIRIYGYNLEVTSGRWTVDDMKIVSTVCGENPTTTPTATATETPIIAPPTATPTSTPTNDPGAPTPTPTATATNGPGTGKGRVTIVLDSLPDFPIERDPDDHEFDGDFDEFTLEDPARSEHPNRQTFTVDPGTYTVGKDEPEFYFVTAINCTPAGSATVDLAASKVTINVRAGDDITCTFVSERAVKIRARVYDDRNENHERNDEEPYLKGWTIKITNLTTGKSESKTTNSYGKVLFKWLRPGEYTICETLKSGWGNTQPSDSLCYKTTVEPSQTARAWFGNSNDEEALESGKLASGADVSTEYVDIIEEGDDEEGSELVPQIYLPIVRKK